MKARMRELNIKMTELSEYVKVSLPTLYKYIESYESVDFSSLPEHILKLFKLMENPGVTKEQVVTFTISSFSETDANDSREKIRRYLANPSSSARKIDFIANLVESDCLDDLIPYLNDCISILSKEKIDDDGTYQVARLLLMKSQLSRNLPLKGDELEEAKKLAEELNVH